MKDPAPGIRHFQCPKCKVTWDEPSRDITSPSGDECVNCGEWVSPHGSTPNRVELSKKELPSSPQDL